MEGRRIHLTHLQFHSYGTEGPHHFSSGAAEIAELVNASPNVSIDVGQVMFGQTVTASADTMAQVRNARFASPKKWVAMDIECEAGCGVLPFRYKQKQYVNALQWCIGLELFLLVQDPWRIFLTTDHPNGAPFTAYPEVLALLMSRDLRNQWMETLPAEAVAVTALPSISREYSLVEIATMTRAAPARLLGLRDRGHLGAGAVADVAIYENDPDRAKMFRSAALVFKSGALVVRDGMPTQHGYGRALTVQPDRDQAIDRRLKRYYDERYGLSDDLIKVPGHAIGRPDPFELVSCRQ
jgi:formylmethanofuran dehydrogenase subunit A